MEKCHLENLIQWHKLLRTILNENEKIIQKSINRVKEIEFAVQEEK